MSWQWTGAITIKKREVPGKGRQHEGGDVGGAGLETTNGKLLGL